MSLREAGARKRDVPATARAYEFYLRANHLSLQMRDLGLAKDMYRMCLEEDPLYAPAWARLARCHRILSKFRAESEDDASLAEEAFQRAFQLSPKLAGSHALYASHQTDQGRAEEAITRLLGLLQENRNDPDLYIGLVYSCRFAGLLNESLAAHQVAESLDPRIRTSVMNTHFVLGQYEMALQRSTDDVGFLEAMALDSLGRREEAMSRVRNRDRLPPLMTKWMVMLDHYLEGRTAQASDLILEINREGRDPEGFFYRARLLARLGCLPQSIKTLEASLEAGFYCASAWKQDSYLESVRSDKRFQQLLNVAVERSSRAQTTFREAGGQRYLKIEE